MFGCSYKQRVQSLILAFNNLIKYLKLGNLELCALYLNIHWIFQGLNPSGRTMALGVDSASNRSEYQEYLPDVKGGRYVGLTNLSLSCADCLEILGASTSWSSKVLSRPVME
jgi:hypothetical protein